MVNDYLALMKERLNSKESHVPAAYGTKRKVKEIADLLGIKVPEVYFVGRLDEIVWDDLPEEFVVKPDFASTNIGVRLLSKDAESAGEHLIDIPSGERIEIAVLEEKFRDIAIRYYGEDHEKGIFLVEELLRAPDGTTPPSDVRAYSFFGKVGMFQIDNHKPGAKQIASYFDGDFQPFEDREERYSFSENAGIPQGIDDSVPVPELAEALIETAQRVSYAVPTAFCRVDMYEANGSVYLGEITFFPGTFYYRDSKLMLEKESERLGVFWEDAKKRIQSSHVQEVKR